MDKELIEKYASLLNSVYLTGSFVVPWIENSHDRDYVIFVNDIWDARIADLYKEKQKDECFFAQRGRKSKIQEYSHTRDILSKSNTVILLGASVIS